MYRSCAITSFAALNKQFSLKADNAIPALMPFTGGIALKGETCGAVSGALLAMGFMFETSNPGSSIKYASMFLDKFEKKFSSTKCKGVQKNQFGRTYDFLNPEEQKLFVEVSQKSGKCMEVVKKAVLIAADIILENS
jgi:C_GCAxxG_C_C family probable redox protein